MWRSAGLARGSSTGRIFKVPTYLVGTCQLEATHRVHHVQHRMAENPSISTACKCRFKQAERTVMDGPNVRIRDLKLGWAVKRVEYQKKHNLTEPASWPELPGPWARCHRSGRFGCRRCDESVCKRPASQRRGTTLGTLLRKDRSLEIDLHTARRVLSHCGVSAGDQTGSDVSTMRQVIWRCHAVSRETEGPAERFHLERQWGGRSLSRTVNGFGR